MAKWEAEFNAQLKSNERDNSEVYKQACLDTAEKCRDVAETVGQILARVPEALLPLASAATNYKCSVCNTSFATESEALDHEVKAHDPYDDALAALNATAPDKVEPTLCFAPWGQEANEDDVLPLPPQYLVPHPATLTAVVAELPSPDLLGKLPQALADAQDSRKAWISSLSDDSPAVLTNSTSLWLELFQNPPAALAPPLRHQIPPLDTSKGWKTAVSSLVTLRTQPPAQSIFGWLASKVRRVADDPPELPQLGTVVPLVNRAQIPDSAAKSIFGTDPRTHYPIITVSQTPPPPRLALDGVELHKCPNCTQLCKIKVEERNKCRNCGKLICANCSSQNHRILHAGFTQARKLCDPCVAAVSQEEANAFLQTAAASLNLSAAYFACDVYGEVAVRTNLSSALASGDCVLAALDFCCLLQKGANLADATISTLKDFFTLAVPKFNPSALPFVVSVTLPHWKQFWIDTARDKWQTSNEELSAQIYGLLQLAPTVLLDEAFFHFQKDNFRLSWQCTSLATSTRTPARFWRDYCGNLVAKQPQAVEFVAQIASIARLPIEARFSWGKSLLLYRNLHNTSLFGSYRIGWVCFRPWRVAPRGPNSKLASTANSPLLTTDLQLSLLRLTLRCHGWQ